MSESDIFEVRTTADRGRGLFALKELEPGLNIMVCDPAVFALEKKYARSRCSYCIDKADKLSRCGGCKYQWYCCKECQKEAWCCDHKEECKMLKGEKEMPSSQILFLARLFRKVLRENSDNPKIARKKGELISLGELESNYDRLDNDQQADIGMFLMRFQTLWGRKFPLPFSSSRQLLDLCAAIKNNMFAICDEEKSNTELGSAIYLNASLLNNSCRPNAIPIFEGKKLYIKALQKINQGEEICIAYTDTKGTIEYRQEYLYSIYRFKCSCGNCSSEEGKKIDARKMADLEGNVLKESDQLIKSVSLAVQDMQEFQEKKEWTLMRDSVKGWLKRKLLPDNNIYWLRLNEFAFDAGIETEDWDLSVKAAGAIIPAYKEYYGNNHPALGVFLMKFGKILTHIGQAKEAEEFFKRAFGILSLFYAPHTKIRADLHNLVLDSYEKAAMAAANEEVNSS